MKLGVRRRLGGAAMAAACLAAPAHAGLGRALRSVEADRAALHATMQSADAGAYAVHTLTLANSGVVREFTRPDGAVFAVAWRAPGRPDLRQLLGDDFAVLQGAGSRPKGRRMRVPLSMNAQGLRVQSGGHPGAFWGLAVIPALEPAGFSASDVK